jgi:hypothetical protein
VLNESFLKHAVTFDTYIARAPRSPSPNHQRSEPDRIHELERKSKFGFCGSCHPFQCSWAPNAAAQQVTGVPGSPSVMTTIDGKQIPPAPPKFGGVIKQDAKDSPPWWPFQRSADHDPRRGLWRAGHVWRRHPDSGTGKAGDSSIPLHFARQRGRR